MKINDLLENTGPSGNSRDTTHRESLGGEKAPQVLYDGKWGVLERESSDRYRWKDDQHSILLDFMPMHGKMSMLFEKNGRQMSPKEIRYYREDHPVLRKIFYRYEAEAAKNPRISMILISYPYSCSMRWRNMGYPEIEKYIMNEPEMAVLYAEFVIKGRWPEAEDSIATNPHSAFTYAAYVLGKRWPKAEPVIMTDKQSWKLYLEWMSHYGHDPADIDDEYIDDEDIDDEYT